MYGWNCEINGLVFILKRSIGNLGMLFLWDACLTHFTIALLKIKIFLLVRVRDENKLFKRIFVGENGFF